MTNRFAAPGLCVDRLPLPRLPRILLRGAETRGRATAIGVVGFALSAVSTAAQADQISMTLDNIYGRGVDFSYDPTGAHTSPQISGNTTAGRFTWNVSTVRIVPEDFRVELHGLLEVRIVRREHP